MLYFFNSSVGFQMSAEQVSREIVSFMKADPQREYKITIGTDSEKDAQNLADFVTAIVVHRVGNGGRYFWRRVEGPGKFHTLRDRITHEVLISLEIAKNFLGELKKSNPATGGPKFDFEIHVDVGENGATKTMMQELVGMIRANNFEVKTKPDSYAASKVADRHV
jgi:predicted RNase H-related nuclease YkuK (DUF458 family)